MGGYILSELEKEYDVVTIGRTKVSHQGLHINCDLSECRDLQLADFNFIVHCASKAHVVPRNSEEASEFFAVNVGGTANLLRALEPNTAEIKKFIFISSVAVYGVASGINVDEKSPLLAKDAYGKSKMQAEKIIIDWCTEKKIPYYILRLPLIAGKNAPGNLGAMVKGIKRGIYLRIGAGAARKSMVLAADLAVFLPRICGPSGVYNLTDGYHPSFKQMEDKISQYYHKRPPFSLPVGIAKLIAFLGNIGIRALPLNSDKLQKIRSTLTFDDTSAKTNLSWNPRQVLQNWEIE